MPSQILSGVPYSSSYTLDRTDHYASVRACAQRHTVVCLCLCVCVSVCLCVCLCITAITAQRLKCKCK